MHLGAKYNPGWSGPSQLFHLEAKFLYLLVKDDKKKTTR